MTINQIEFDRTQSHPGFARPAPSGSGHAPARAAAAVGPSYYDINYLAARGFSTSPQATGGLISRIEGRQGGMTTPKEVVVPAGSQLVRFYGRGADGVGADPDGAWWWTPWELLQLADYLGHQDFSSGLGSQGTSVLHKAGIVLGSWSTAEMFRIIELRQPFSAFFGEGDGAEWTRQAAGQQRSSYVKGLRILGSNGVQRYLRQLFIPGFWNYRDGTHEKCSGATGSHFAGELQKLSRAMLPFEA